MTPDVEAPVPFDGASGQQAVRAVRDLLTDGRVHRHGEVCAVARSTGLSRDAAVDLLRAGAECRPPLWRRFRKSSGQKRSGVLYVATVRQNPAGDGNGPQNGARAPKTGQGPVGGLLQPIEHPPVVLRGLAPRDAPERAGRQRRSAGHIRQTWRNLDGMRLRHGQRVRDAQLREHGELGDAPGG